MRFEAENRRIPEREKPNKLKKAARLVEVAGQRDSSHPGSLFELLRYVVEDIRGGDLSADWKPVQDLRQALGVDGYRFEERRLAHEAAPANFESNMKSDIQLLQEVPVRTQAQGRDVFLVHGRNVALRDALIQLLRALDLKVITWREAASAAGGGTPYTGDIVRAGMDLADAVVVLLTPDDVGYVREAFRERHDNRDEVEPTGQARLNVVFEAGMAMAIDRARVVVVEIGHVRQMSDTAGINVIRLHDAIDRRKDLAARLKAVGLAVDDGGEEWRTAGKFDRPDLTETDLLPSVTPGSSEKSGEPPATEVEHAVLAHLHEHFSNPENHRLNTPFDVPGIEWPQVQVVLRDLADADPPYIKGVEVSQADYPVVLTGLTERGRRVASLDLSSGAVGR